MKTTKKIFIVAILLFAFIKTTGAQQLGTLELWYGDLYFNDPEQPWLGYETYINTIQVTPNTPILITYTHNTDNRIEIYSNEVSYVNKFYVGVSEVVRVVSSDGYIYVRSSYNWGYIPQNVPIYTMSYELDSSQVVSNDLIANKDVVINGKLGVGTLNPKSKFEVLDGVGKFTFSGAAATSAYEVGQTIDNTGYKINVGSATRNYKISLNGADVFKLSGTNVGFGSTALNANVTGSNNFASGTYSLRDVTTGACNFAYGSSTLKYTTTGSNNIAIGTSSLMANTVGSNNIATGVGALGSNTTGSNNIALGNYSGGFLTNGATGNATGTNSIYIGEGTRALAAGQMNEIVLGTNAIGNGSNTVTLGSASGVYAITKTILNGNVLIGNTIDDNTNKLQVNGSILSTGSIASNGNFLSNNSSDQIQLQSYTAVGKTWRLGTSIGSSGANRNFTIWESDLGNALTINQANGSVGIGTSIPDSLLTVKGGIHARSLVLDLNGPLADFVFHPSYNLMPLQQVEQYVKTNSHLPEMPSADDVSKKGMNMGDMQNKLLQKVEELTLYIIEQQKRIDDLEKKLK